MVKSPTKRKNPRANNSKPKFAAIVGSPVALLRVNKVA